MTDKLVSVLLPTRKRVDKLYQSLLTLEAGASDPKRIEVLVRVDDDDEETIAFFDKGYSRAFDTKVMVRPRGNGYADLHTMYNELCSRSQGRFLFLWNDDAEMVTRGWDDELARCDDGRLRYVVSQVWDHRNRDSYLFPIVHRSYYEALGHFSLSAHNDTYVFNVLRGFPVFYRSNIVIKHHALYLRDQTGSEARQWWPTTKGLWSGPEVQQGLQADVQKIDELLKQQNDKGLGSQETKG